MRSAVFFSDYRQSQRDVNASSGVIYGSHSQHGLEFRGRNDIDITLG